MPSPKMLSPTSFATTIEGIVRKDRIDYIDAIMEFSERNMIEIEVIQSLIRKSPTIKSKLFAEAVKARRVHAPTSAEIAFA